MTMILFISMFTMTFLKITKRSVSKYHTMCYIHVCAFFNFIQKKKFQCFRFHSYKAKPPIVHSLPSSSSFIHTVVFYFSNVQSFGSSRFGLLVKKRGKITATNRSKPYNESCTT